MLSKVCWSWYFVTLCLTFLQVNFSAKSHSYRNFTESVNVDLICPPIPSPNDNNQILSINFYGPGLIFELDNWKDWNKANWSKLRKIISSKHHIRKDKWKTIIFGDIVQFIPRWDKSIKHTGFGNWNFNSIMLCLLSTKQNSRKLSHYKGFKNCISFLWGIY